MKKEHEFVLNTVLVNKTDAEQDKINELLSGKLDWCEIAGQLFNHRLGGYFLKGLSVSNLIHLPTELYESLRLLVSSQRNETLLMVNEVLPILHEMEKEGVKYAGLKGIVFNADFYIAGDRRSSDIDLLVCEEDLIKIDIILRKYGYIQSLMPDGQLTEANKKEKLVQRMNYHDLVPYVKKTSWGISEIDINFLFDSKENLIDKKIFNYKRIDYYGKDYTVKGLPFYINLAHLCIHFFREATNTLWTSWNRDVALYKIVDIMNSLRAHKNELICDEWVTLMTELNLQNKCYYTFYILGQFYDDPFLAYLENALRPDDISFVNEIKVDGEDRTIKRTEKFIESAFRHNH